MTPRQIKSDQALTLKTYWTKIKQLNEFCMREGILVKCICLLEIMSQYQNDETQSINLHLHEVEHKKTQMQRNVLKHVIK